MLSLRDNTQRALAAGHKAQFQEAHENEWQAGKMKNATLNAAVTSGD